MQKLWYFIRSQLVNKSQKTLSLRPPQVVKKTLIRHQVVKKTDLIRPQMALDQRLYTTRNYDTERLYTTRNYFTDAFNESLEVIINKIHWSYQKKRFDEEFLDTMPQIIRCLKAKAVVMGIYSDELVHECIVHLFCRFVSSSEFIHYYRPKRSRNTLLPGDSAKISPEFHLHHMEVPSKVLLSRKLVVDRNALPSKVLLSRILAVDRIALPSKVLLSRILVVDRIASLKLLQSFHAKTVVMGISLDKEMLETLEDLYHIVMLPRIQKLVEDGKLDEAVKLVKEMSPFKVKRSLCEPIINACAKSLPVDVKTVRDLFEMMRLSPNELYFMDDQDAHDKLEAAGIVWPCLVLGPWDFVRRS